MSDLTSDEFNESWRLRPDTFALKMSEGDWQRYNYLNYLGRKVAETVFNGGKLIVEIPPRHGKSELISFWTPIWFLSLFPHKKVIFATYEAEFAALWGRRCRNKIQESPDIPVTIPTDSQAASRWETSKGGGMFTTGAGGPITGRGGHLLLIDDITKNSEQAGSAAYQRRNIEWYQSTFATRAEPGSATIVLGTRWNENDLQGWLQNDKDQKGQWEVIRLPAIAEGKNSMKNDPLGRRRGMALCPERYDEKALAQLKKEVGAYYWAALFQQRPAPLEGGIFKRKWFKHYTIDQLPMEMDEYIQSWDLAFTGHAKSAFTVGQVWGRHGANKYLIAQVRKQMDFVETVEAIKALTAKYPEARVKLIEKAANGEAVLSSLRDTVQGMVGVKATRSKEDRALAVQQDFEAGNVFFPEVGTKPWVGDFIEEIASFPNSKYKDQTDTMVQALQRLGKYDTSNVDFLSMRKTSVLKGLR